MKTYFRCPVCRKLTSGRLPVGGDGTFYYPRRHVNPYTRAQCEGNIMEAELVSEADADAERCKFGQLSVGEVFEFESFYKFHGSGIEAGPWRKISTRKYCKTSDSSFVSSVGQVGVHVRRLSKEGA